MVNTAKNFLTIPNSSLQMPLYCIKKLKLFQKVAAVTSDFIGNKIADRITKV